MINIMAKVMSIMMIMIMATMMRVNMCRYAYATLQASSLLSKQFMLTRQQVVGNITMRMRRMHMVVMMKTIIFGK